MAERPEDAKRALAKGTKQLETDRAIVTEWRFPPGGHTGWHRHGHDYVVVPITSGDLAIWTGSQEVRSALATGVSYTRAAGVEHDVINPNDFEFVFIEVELKP
ncbi:cupin domain-containing protein [Vineibacter terrae]|uniref:cupin domain-containing protein n=1 Tax=Vineibacter terrae TaxID=2586908 RepID=UPI002E2F0BA9|nr:cupin domain-containing protein [Vineibacter terrae]HEX2889540.1 cupin domain-containing protein [Vineibacter terrae]